jgi:hypothetical protein
MIAPRVAWGDLVPPEVRASVEPLIAPRLRFLPPWCRLLRVHWSEASETDSAGDSLTATMASSVAYREAVLTIHPTWLGLDDGHRAFMIAHELAHCLVAPMDDVFDRAVAHLKKPNRALHGELVEAYRLALEGVVSDLGAVLVVPEEP